MNICAPVSFISDIAHTPGVWWSDMVLLVMADISGFRTFSDVETLALTVTVYNSPNCVVIKTPSTFNSIDHVHFSQLSAAKLSASFHRCVVSFLLQTLEILQS